MQEEQIISGFETKLELPLPAAGQAHNLLGERDAHLTLLEQTLSVRMIPREYTVSVSGTAAQVEKAKQVWAELCALVEANVAITPASVRYALSMVSKDEGGPQFGKLAKAIYTTPRGKQIKAKTLGQRQYLDAIQQHDITFGIGPAGTGKTYLAVVMAVMALKKRDVAKIILVRPAVEAGEKLGFLPGDLQEKVNPYLRPVYDALDDVLGIEAAARHIERHIIEVAPLAYMRGRTLDDAFVILDEAQNTTPQQMKMFLTRLGMGSKAVVTGDVTQVDLPKGQISGLQQAEEILTGVKGLAFCYLTQLDVVRHPLVQRIIEAYERHLPPKQEADGLK